MTPVHLFFKKYFDHKKKNVHGFSLRSLAQRLDISPSFLSRILNGQKAIPSSLFAPLAAALDISPEVLSQIQDSIQVLAPAKKQSGFKTATEDWELAEPSHSRLLTQWFYIPILELFSLKNFDGSILQIARRLHISPSTAEVAVRELVFLKCLTEKNGKLSKSKRKLRFSSSKSTFEIRSFHSKMLDKAKEELKQSSLEDFNNRLITGITVTAPREKIASAKRKLSECLHEIANDLTSESGDEVYHLSAQLFPISKGK